MGLDYDPELFLGGELSPTFFGSALTNFGVRLLLDAVIDLAPAPGPRLDREGQPRPLDAPFSGFVFKVQANMDRSHRDRIAFLRVCSGRFERGMVVTHSETGKPFATKYAHQVFGSDRETVDEAYPGDVVGLVNANEVRVGDTLWMDDAVTYPRIPSFAPEHFSVARVRDTSRFKQFRKGWPSSMRRAWCRYCAIPILEIRRRFWPRWDRCSSMWLFTGWRPSSERRSS